MKEPNPWINFQDSLPQLGMSIDLMADEVILLNRGSLRRIENLGGQWIGMDTENYIGMAVKPHYKWRQT